jgi:hypothetical protein
MITCEVCGTDYDGPVCPDCHNQQKPYYRKNLEPGKARDQFTVELNSQERLWLEALKARLDFQSDSKIMKLCLENAINSNNLSLSDKTWRYVLSTKRQRLSSFKTLPEPTPIENARVKP